MLKTEKAVIDGFEISSTQLPAMRSYVLLTKLGKIIGPVLAEASKLENVSAEADIAVLVPAISALFENIDPGESERLAIDILCSTQVIVDGKMETLIDSSAINRVFGGKVLAMLKTIAFALRVNYGDFFEGLAEARAEREAAKKAQSS